MAKVLASPRRHLPNQSVHQPVSAEDSSHGHVLPVKMSMLTSPQIVLSARLVSFTISTETVLTATLNQGPVRATVFVTVLFHGVVPVVRTKRRLCNQSALNASMGMLSIARPSSVLASVHVLKAVTVVERTQQDVWVASKQALIH